MELDPARLKEAQDPSVNRLLGRYYFEMINKRFNYSIRTHPTNYLLDSDIALRTCI
jgi:hypothetical protein